MAPPGRRRNSLSPAAMLLGLLFLFSSTASAASAVLGVDLGTEYIKAALVKPGVPLEIVLTKDSRRKETSAIAFKPLKSGALPEGSFPERFYGADAIALQARFPGDVYPNLKHLLGASSGSDAVKIYNGRYPAIEIADTEGRKTVSFKSSVFSKEEEKSFSVEEVLGMVLKNVRENAKALAGTGYDVQDVVFTVPPFYTVEERRALEVSAKLAGLKVLSVVSDGVAVGINYATGRTFPVVNDKKEPGKPEVNLVFDMGAGSASATVLQFQGRSVKDVGKRNKTIQEVNVLGASWDRTLGGDALNSLIVDDIVNTFLELPATKSASITAEKVYGHGRTAAKMFKEAERIRQVLSANQATQASFESFFEDIDFKYKLDRTKFEQLAADISARVDAPIKKALEAAGLTIADIDSVIVHGGATRTPFVQARLEAVAGKDKIRANVNSDEAAVFGAAFKAAGLSPSFRVKEIRDSDTQGYSHSIEYMHNMKTKNQNIFTPSTKLGATKDLPFNMMGEFEFTVHQHVPSASGKETKEPTLLFKSLNLTETVTKLIDNEGCERDSFNNYVQVRLSPVTGTPEVTSAWVTCEATEAKAGIVDGVKNLFGMGGRKDQEALKEGESSSESASASSSVSSSKSSKGSKSSSAAAAEASDDGKPKKKTVRSNITWDAKKLGYEKFPRKEFRKMQDRLAAFDASDKARRVREEVLNSLEAYTYRARDYFDDEDFTAVTTKDVLTQLEEKLNAASEWVYSEGPNADEKSLRAKLKELEDIVNPVLRRRRESWKRPGAITELEETIAGMKEVDDLVKNQIAERAVYVTKSAEAASSSSASPSASPSVDPLDELEEEGIDSAPSASATPELEEVPEIYTEADRTKISSVTEKVKKWLDETRTKQDKLAAHEEPVLTVEQLKTYKKELDDVVMEMMMKKMKHFKPPKPKASPKPKAKKTSKPKKSKAEKPAETPVAPKEGEAETEAPDVQAQADQQKEDIKNGGPNAESYGGHGPTEEELREAFAKAGVEMTEEGIRKVVEQEKHDEL
ncbi:lumenal Hsp70 protein [Didymella heteroderae]|uniref:Lumenal Hsp70 protein n=1 Tax=Didymella heteroderae TaxID=1769908 RepID=A0A9P5C1E8_9PLEO|nr:lumenal Hsp70 protein [Didymella heteroderae]